MRFSAHFLKISENDPDSEIARHFNSGCHKGLDDVMIHIVDFVYAAPDSAKAKYLRDLLEFNREGAKNSGGKRQAQYMPVDYR